MIKTGTDWIEFVTEHIEMTQNKILRNQERLDSLKVDLITTAGLQYKEDKVQTSCSGDKLSEKYAMITEIDREIKQDCKELAEFKDRSTKEIESLVPNPSLVRCLELRHVRLKSNSEIAIELGLSERQIIRKFIKAYNLLDSIYILEKYRKKIKKVDMSPQKVVI